MKKPVCPFNLLAYERIAAWLVSSYGRFLQVVWMTSLCIVMGHLEGDCDSSLVQQHLEGGTVGEGKSFKGKHRYDERSG
jgi:hypothetical protein